MELTLDACWRGEGPKAETYLFQFLYYQGFPSVRVVHNRYERWIASIRYARCLEGRKRFRECCPACLSIYDLETGSINPYIQNENNLIFASHIKQIMRHRLINCAWVSLISLSIRIQHREREVARRRKINS